MVTVVMIGPEERTYETAAEVFYRPDAPNITVKTLKQC